MRGKSSTAAASSLTKQTEDLIIDKFIMPSHTIELSETEANNLMQLLDLAIKAHGLNVAEAAVTIAQKVVAAKQLKPVTNGKKG